MTFNIALSLLFLFSSLSFAQATQSTEETKPATVEDAPMPIENPNLPPRTPYRSDMNSHVWIGGNVGLDFSPRMAGLATGGGLGGHMDLNLRLRMGRCGPMLHYRNESLYYFDPAHVHNMMGGLGVFCQGPPIGYRFRGFRGAHVQVHALIEYGRSNYAIDDSSAYRTNSGHHEAMGATVGGDFFFPLWFGFWAHAGASLEGNTFRYETSDQRGETVRSSDASWLVLLRLGVTYAFL